MVYKVDNESNSEDNSNGYDVYREMAVMVIMVVAYGVCWQAYGDSGGSGDDEDIVKVGTE